MPVLINEDDHFRFNEPENHMMAAIAEYVSWGYFDPGKSDYSDGHQCPPVNWGINTRAQAGVLLQTQRGDRKLMAVTRRPARSKLIFVVALSGVFEVRAATR